MTTTSIDFGATWTKAELEAPANRFAWQHWNAKVEFPETGYYEIWARATDSAGAICRPGTFVTIP